MARVRPWMGRRISVAASTVLALTALPMVWASPASAQGRVAPLSADVSATTVLTGAEVAVAGSTTTGARKVTLQRLSGGRWVAVASATVSAAGRFSASVQAPHAPETLTLEVRAAVRGRRLSSSPLHVHVVARAFSATLIAPRTVPVGRPLVVRGSVAPRASGVVEIEQLQGSNWRRVALARLTKTSTYSTPLPTTRPGLFTLRVVSPSTPSRASGSSRRVVVAVQQAPVETQPVAPPAPPSTAPPAAGPPAPAQPDPAPVISTEEQSGFGDSGNSNVLSGVGVKPSLTPAWADGSIGTPSSIVVGDGTVFAAGWDGAGDVAVTALRESDGSIFWGPQLIPQLSAGDGMLAYDRGHVFLLTTSCTLASVSATTGRLEWLDPDNNQWSCRQPPVAANGHLVLMSANVAAIDESSGKPLWSYPLDPVHSGPAVVGDKVVVDDGTLMPGVLDAATGRLLWAARGANTSSGRTPAVAGGRVYAQEWATHVGTTYDLASGRRLGMWTGDSPPAVDPGHDLLIADDSDDPSSYYVCSCTLTARSLSTNQVSWTFDTRDHDTSPPLVVDGVVYTTDWGNLYALDEQTGRVLSTLTLPSWALNPPEFSQLAAGDGLLLASVSDGLVALRTDAASSTSPYEYEEYTPTADCPDEQDVYYVSRTCNWTYPQPRAGADLVRVSWDPLRSRSMDAKVEDSAGHVYAQGTGTTGLLELPTASVPAGATVHVAVTDHGADYAMDFSEALPRIDQPATLTPTTSVLGFGYVLQGATSAESVVLRNTGGRELAVTGVRLVDRSGNTFTGVTDTCTLAILPPGWPCTLRVAAHPAGSATMTGELVVSTTSGDVTIGLSAAGARG